LRRTRNRGGVDDFALDRQDRRDHRHVAQRQGVERRDENRAAAQLHGVLRGADHGGANALDRRFEVRAEAIDAGANLGRQQRPEVAELAGFVAVNEFRHAAGKLDPRDRVFALQRLGPQQRHTLRHGRVATHRLEQLIRHRPA
jgi:hypothetical protein